MDSNTFEERQEGKRKRYLRRAEKAREESNRHGNEADRMAKMMNGQPIFIGHHSKKRHRRDIERTQYPDGYMD